VRDFASLGALSTSALVFVVDIVDLDLVRVR
jgi:hypothetical protein